MNRRAAERCVRLLDKIYKECGMQMVRRKEQFCRKILASISIANESLVQDMASCAQASKQPKGAVLLRTGEVQNQMHFLLSGFCRGYFIDESGNEITDCFAYRTGEPVVALGPLGSSSPITIETLEKTELLSIAAKDLDDLMERWPVLYQVKAQLLQEAFYRHWEAKRALYQYSALQRYQWFCGAYPGVIDRVKHSYVASFLNMTPVTLSRLRRQLREAAGL